MEKIDLTAYTHLLPQDCELRQQENRSVTISLLNGSVTENSVNSETGISARVCDRGSWGFASMPGADARSVSKVLQLAGQNASFLAERSSACDILAPAGVAKRYTQQDAFISAPNMQKRLEYLFALDKYIDSRYPDIASRSIRLIERSFEKNIVTGFGASVQQNMPFCNIHVCLTDNEGGENTDIFRIFGGAGVFETWFVSVESYFEKIEQQYQALRAKKNGIVPQAGMRDVILAPNMVGMLAHEAIGHTVEGDVVLAGSVVNGKIGQQVASELVTLVDYAHSAFGEPCPVPLIVDDEGVAAQDAVIIEHGILHSYMHNRETAKHFEMKPTGNARAHGYFDEPMARMRNTVVNPGDSKLEDMVASIQDGYYLVSSRNGQADSTGEFMFSVGEGYEIKNGKVGRGLKEFTVAGQAFEVLGNVSMIADTVELFCTGYCEKKQLIITAEGGAALKTKMQIGGK